MAGIAPIYSHTSGDQSHRESAAWAAFTAPRDSAVFYASWLAILCSQIGKVNAALLVLDSDQPGSYAPAAVWPDTARDLHYLGPAATRALVEGRGFIDASEGDAGSALAAYPIAVDGSVHGAVVLEVAAGTDAELQRALRLLHWASAWLVDQIRQRTQETLDAGLHRMSLAMDLAATALQEQRFGHAAIALSNEIAAKLFCERASIGFDNNGEVEVQAISNTATFDRKTDLVRQIADAMDEALDLDGVVVHPPQGDFLLANMAHAALAGSSSAICSVALTARGQRIGILTLQRPVEQGFSAADIELCKSIGELLGPVLDLKRENERSVWRRLRDSANNGARMMFGPGHPGAKLIASLLALFVLLASLVTMPYRVAARTVIEGSVRRAAVAPFDGFVAESLVRAGDTVKKGQLLCRLDDRDLRLEQTKWLAEREQSDRKYRQALSARDRSAAAVMAARIEQAQAQLSLVEEKLQRATLFAPFDGVVVSGDLSQLLGAPVEVGKLLFEIAPLDAYRVILNVDERDISYIDVGQQGDLALAGIPDRKLPFEVKLVTPVAAAQEGGNYFRVEARIESSSAERLRPGMEGVGKIEVGERKLIWIWTHGLVDWLRVSLWKWLP